MDVRRLVDRVSAVLGEAATPERVEAVAALVLEEVGVAVPPPAARPDASPAPLPPERVTSGPAQRAVVLAYGVDRPGVSEALARAAAETGCTVADASYHVLDGYFSLIMLLDVAALQMSVAELQRRLTHTATRLGVSVLVQHEWLFKTTRPA